MKLEISDAATPASRLWQILSGYSGGASPEIRGWRRRLRKSRHRRCREIATFSLGDMNSPS